MNYLAHLVLSPANDGVLFGNYIADSIRPKEQIGWTTDMKIGYRRHILIDQYTDAHDSFRQAKEILRTSHGKYAPVVLDILNDHLLAKHWDDFQTLPFGEWEQSVYRRLQPFQKFHLPTKARKLLDGLLQYQYLHVYASREGTYDVLRRMDRRANFPSNFVRGINDLYDNLAIFRKLFLQLFEDLMKEFSSDIEQSKTYK